MKMFQLLLAVVIVDDIAIGAAAAAAAATAAVVILGMAVVIYVSEDERDFPDSLDQAIDNARNNINRWLGNESEECTQNCPLMNEQAPSEEAPPASAPQTAEDEIRALGPLEGKTQEEIEQQLRDAGFTPVTGRNGGTIWTKPSADGNTAAVRIDPATVRPRPRGHADEVPHTHKEVVPTSQVTNGNYQPVDATRYNDQGQPSTDRRATHIRRGP